MLLAKAVWGELLRTPSSRSSPSENHSSPPTDRLGSSRPLQQSETIYSQPQEDLALFSSPHLEVKKAGSLVCPICNQTNTILPKGAPIGESSGEHIIESEPQFLYAACTNCGYSIFFNTDYLPRRQSS